MRLKLTQVETINPNDEMTTKKDVKGLFSNISLKENNDINNDANMNIKLNMWSIIKYSMRLCVQFLSSL